jgi:hypothetical protein
LQKILQEIVEKKYLEQQTLGRRVICSSKPAYYNVDCWILNEKHENENYPTLTVNYRRGKIVSHKNSLFAHEAFQYFALKEYLFA